jgi:glutathione S-transferase
MRLLYTPINGYVHTVEAVINYADLRGRVEPVPTKPYAVDTTLGDVNPIGKVPTLVLDDGEYLAGGPVIYEYLDSLHPRPKLYPASGRRRFTVLRQAWMADALFDTLVLLIVEGWIERDRQRPAYVARCWDKVLRILDQMEREATGHGALDIAQVRGVGALAFLDLKVRQIGTDAVGLDPDFAWRSGRSQLASWYARIGADAIYHEPLLPWKAGVAPA